MMTARPRRRDIFKPPGSAEPGGLNIESRVHLSKWVTPDRRRLGHAVIANCALKRESTARDASSDIVYEADARATVAA